MRFMDGGGEKRRDWPGFVIYQLLTDRFARSPNRWGRFSACRNLEDYCGGTYRGIISQLNYLVKLGVDVIWISPVVENVAGGYHGYWARSLNKLNPHFGTPADLQNLVRAAHARGIRVMVDVVLNHMGRGWEDLPDFEPPWNDTSLYHNCSGCDDQCSVADYENRTQMEHCRLFGLPDLDQANKKVRTLLLDWIETLVLDYDFDALRLDTVPYVSNDFWVELARRVPGVYLLGEVANGDPAFIKHFSSSTTIDSFFNFPLYYACVDVFVMLQPMSELREKIEKIWDVLGRDTSRTMTNFVENADWGRLSVIQKSEPIYFNLMTFLMLFEGTPVLFYGCELGLGFDQKCSDEWYALQQHNNNGDGGGGGNGSGDGSSSRDALIFRTESFAGTGSGSGAGSGGGSGCTGRGESDTISCLPDSEKRIPLWTTEFRTSGSGNIQHDVLRTQLYETLRLLIGIRKDIDSAGLVNLLDHNSTADTLIFSRGAEDAIVVISNSPKLRTATVALNIPAPRKGENRKVFCDVMGFTTGEDKPTLDSLDLSCESVRRIDDGPHAYLDIASGGLVFLSAQVAKLTSL